jgi:hypothetical protein
MAAEAWLALGALELQDGRLSDASAALEQARADGADPETRRAATALAAIVRGEAEARQALGALELSDHGRRRIVHRALRAAARTASPSRT